MAARHVVQDILLLLENNTYVLKDTNKHLQIELAALKMVHGKTVEHMKKLFCNGRAIDVKCSVDLDNGILNFKEGACTHPKTTKQTNVDLNAVTESEKTLQDFAQRLGTVDYDDLCPKFNLSNSDGTTTLHIEGLLHVSHDALCYYAKDLPNGVLHYNMQRKSVDVLLLQQAKRKR